MLVIYVSPKGNDTHGTGVFKSPLRTLDNAIQRVRFMRQNPTLRAREVNIILTGGRSVISLLAVGPFVHPLPLRHVIESTIGLVESDSGTATAPFVIRSFPGTRAVLTGGMPSTPYRGRLIDPLAPAAIPLPSRMWEYVDEKMFVGGRAVDVDRIVSIPLDDLVRDAQSVCRPVRPL